MAKRTMQVGFSPLIFLRIHKKKIGNKYAKNSR